MRRIHVEKQADPKQEAHAAGQECSIVPPNNVKARAGALGGREVANGAEEGRGRGLTGQVPGGPRGSKREGQEGKGGQGQGPGRCEPGSLVPSGQGVGQQQQQWARRCLLRRSKKEPPLCHVLGQRQQQELLVTGRQSARTCDCNDTDQAQGGGHDQNFNSSTCKPSHGLAIKSPSRAATVSDAVIGESKGASNMPANDKHHHHSLAHTESY
ncbi:hypothetical protein PSV09DRAFT_2256580 [Bipolaris maydis]|uniref:uncharacterized protein n=1 Tax=Cochliobolus heterostrophus TaxID=5016 RepID=UPI0024D240B6|nr:hypothetical protein J3E74DRAFT_290703 [Bipolaris maydis]KAJ6211246.1 hypothetical protein PSV09DRAFT_2256580 [Bipolaris maydis]KAJ6273629.1 hypothetical protein PSV08DRAFT_244829 [Bipolaris maydis]KAJ6284846.1 hypothetical protein J3E71DRAFT_237839 [Bipolaris maydis]